MSADDLVAELREHPVTIAWAAAAAIEARDAEIAALRSAIGLLVEGISPTCAEVHIGWRRSPWVPVDDREFAAIERALTTEGDTP